MKLSVIVTIYNREAVLRRCVDSILAQNMTDYEVILVDDGSRDAADGSWRHMNAAIRSGFAACIGRTAEWLVQEMQGLPPPAGNISRMWTVMTGSRRMSWGSWNESGTDAGGYSAL